jgi:hypothetical protein
VKAGRCSSPRNAYRISRLHESKDALFAMVHPSAVVVWTANCENRAKRHG